MGGGGGGGSSLGQTVINGSGRNPGAAGDPLRQGRGLGGGRTGSGTAGLIIIRYPIEASS
jgi:hypothetical protein